MQNINNIVDGWTYWNLLQQRRSHLVRIQWVLKWNCVPHTFFPLKDSKSSTCIQWMHYYDVFIIYLLYLVMIFSWCAHIFHYSWKTFVIICKQFKFEFEFDMEIEIGNKKYEYDRSTCCYMHQFSFIQCDMRLPI